MISAQGNHKDVSAMPPTYPKCVVLTLILMYNCGFLKLFSPLKYSLDSLGNKWFIPHNNGRGSYI